MRSQSLWIPTAVKKALGIFMLLAGLVVFSPGALAQTVTRYTNTTDSAVNQISDTGTPCSAPFTRTFSVGTSGTVSDVNIGVLMAHTYRADVQMTLVSPAGTRVVIFNRENGGADNFNVLMDDEAASAMSGYTINDTATATTTVPPYASTYKPSNVLTAFDGQNTLGTWTLEICDTAAVDEGTFYQADLYLTTAPSNYADLSLTQSISATTPANGTTVTYTLTVTNAASSPLTATGITVRDLLPAGVNFVSSSGVGSYNSTTGDWSVGTLAPGQTASRTITVTVNATAGASVANFAEITASSVADLDSTPNNGVTSEDDYASSSFTVSGTRTAGTPPVLTCSVGSSLFDWDAQAWTAGSTSNNYTLSGFGSVTFTISNPSGVFINNATYGGLSPARQNAVTGGLAVPQFSLAQLVDLTSQSAAATTVITLGSPAAGAQFTIFDVDYAAGQFADKVTVTGSYKGSTVLPTLTNNVANYVIGNSAYGDATSGDTQANGNVVVTFSSPVDTITIAYGDHALAPTDPGQQGIEIHDVTFCKPTASISVTKVSSVISDPINGSTNPKRIPGALIEYCILVSNTGLATLTNLVATDNLPSNFTYAAGTMQSGTTCSTATTAEDDNNTGTDESDPFGAAISGTSLTATAASLSGSSAFALKLRGTVN